MNTNALPIHTFSYSNFYYFNNFHLNYNITTFLAFSFINNKSKNFSGKFSYESTLPEAPSTFYNQKLNFMDKFMFLKRPLFISFFIEHMIDVPYCFKKSKSLKNGSFERPLLKFVNLFMRHGRQEKMNRFFSKALVLASHDIKPTHFNFLKDNQWFRFFLYTSNQFYSDKISIFYSLEDNLAGSDKDKIDIDTLQELPYKHTLSEEGKRITPFFLKKNLLIDTLSQFNPVFNFYLHYVGKTAWKHSRGKSGRYKCVWKYVPQYKRLFEVIRWISKEVKFTDKKKFFNKMYTVFMILFTKPHLSLIYKIKNFTNSYIYKNYRYSLLTTLKTIK